MLGDPIINLTKTFLDNLALNPFERDEVPGENFCLLNKKGKINSVTEGPLKVVVRGLCERKYTVNEIKYLEIAFH